MCNSGVNNDFQSVHLIHHCGQFLGLFETFYKSHLVLLAQIYYTTSQSEKMTSFSDTTCPKFYALFMVNNHLTLMGWGSPINAIALAVCNDLTKCKPKSCAGEYNYVANFFAG